MQAFDTWINRLQTGIGRSSTVCHHLVFRMMYLLAISTDFDLTEQLQLRTQTHRLRKTTIHLKKPQGYRSCIVIYHNGHATAFGIDMYHTPSDKY